MIAKQKRAQTSRRERHEQQAKKQFEKNMVKRKLKIGAMPRTVFDFQMKDVPEKTDKKLEVSADETNVIDYSQS